MNRLCSSPRVSSQTIPCRLPIALVALIGSIAASQAAMAVSPGLVEFTIGRQSLRGIPIMDFSSELIVLGRDGQIHTLTGRAKDSIRPLDGVYEPASTMEMRSNLQREFGREFEVLSTQHFLVVQPRGRGKRWPDTFERSHRAFIGYMSKRGVMIRRVGFPLVAVVMPYSAAR